MKKMNPWAKLLPVLFIPFFIFGLCNKGDELPDYPDADEYFTWRIPGHNGNITDPPDSVTHGYYLVNKNVIVSYNQSHTTNTYMNFDAGMGTGTFTSGYFNIYTGGKYFVSSGNVQVQVNSYGAPGQFITGTYSGTVRDSANSSQTYAVTGTFKVKNN